MKLPRKKSWVGLHERDRRVRQTVRRESDRETYSYRLLNLVLQRRVTLGVVVASALTLRTARLAALFLFNIIPYSLPPNT